MIERQSPPAVRMYRIVGLFALSLGLLGAIVAACSGGIEGVGTSILILWSLPCALVGVGLLIADDLQRPASSKEQSADGANRVAMRRRRRGSVAAVALAILFVWGVAWIVRVRRIPNEGALAVVAKDVVSSSDVAVARPPRATPIDDAAARIQAGSPPSRVAAGASSQPPRDRAPLALDGGGGAVRLAATPPTVPDEPLPRYQAVRHLVGEVRIAGSDTMIDLMQRLASGFTERVPDVAVTIEGKGSSTALLALVAASADLGAMVREMRAPELKRFDEKFGYQPTAIRVGFDALAIYVHHDNPIARLTLPQTDAIFSATRKRGESSEITRWGQLGLEGAWADRPLAVFGRNSAASVYGFAMEYLLAKGDFKGTVREQPGSASLVAGVASELGGCGYAGPGYATAGVRAVPIVDDHGASIEPTHAQIRAGRYPISRPLWIYFNRAPRTPLPAPVRELLLYTLSREGQDAVASADFTPLTVELADAERARVH